MPNYKIRRAGRLTQDTGLTEKNRGRGSFRRQLKRHSVALISLFVALTSLGYNTWRNETSELHRNWRQAAFQTMIELSEVQQIVLYRRYFHGREEHPLATFHDSRTWVTGWGKVAAIRDLTSVLPAPVPASGEQLFAVWQAHAASLDAGSREAPEAEQALLDSIAEVRATTLDLIHRLR